MSDPLKVEALAQAVSTISWIVNPLSESCDFTDSTSYPVFPAGTGSCQINSSEGTSGPRYLPMGPISLCNNLNHARANASASSSGFS